MEDQADLFYVRKMAPTTDRADMKKRKITETVVDLAVTLLGIASASDSVDARGISSKRKYISRVRNPQD